MNKQMKEIPLIIMILPVSMIDTFHMWSVLILWQLYETAIHLLIGR